MRAASDIEGVNLSTGERWRRVVGDGESQLQVINRGPVDVARLGPQREVVFGPIEPTEDEVIRRAQELLEQARNK